MLHSLRNGRNEQPRTRSRRQWLALLFLLSVFCGCITPWEKSALLKDSTPNIDNIQGPEERRLRLLWWQRKIEKPDESAVLAPLAGTDEYLAATDLYNDQKYPEAQDAFKKVAKKYKKKEIREDALFMQGEAAFQQEHYSKAHDCYAILLREYPSTRHLDVVSERLFKIGRIWLDFPEVATLDEIKQVNFEDPQHRLPAESPPKLNNTPIFRPNFRDKSRPLFDTPGNGVAALQAIWMNDPTGPLADDAMMLVASHHARQGNWVDADRYFRMLRETFPNSPHLQDAFLLGSHVKLMSYQGPDYDGKTLTDAEQLKQSTIRLFPNIADADRLRYELERIEDAKAEREWKQVEFWLHKKQKRAACVCCHLLIDHFPKSKYADQARTTLEQLGPEYASGAVLLTPLDPKKPKWYMRILPGSQATTLPAATPPAKSGDADKPKEDQPPPQWLPNPFRKAPAATPGRPAGEPSNTPESDHPDEDAPSNNVVASGTKPDGKQPASKRNWGFWPAPKQLPADADAKKLQDNDQSGRAKVQTSTQDTD